MITSLVVFSLAREMNLAKYSFQLQCGRVYYGGEILWQNKVVFTSVGNRVASYDLETHQTRTLPYEALYSIHHLSVSRKGLIAVVDEKGFGSFIHAASGQSVAHINFGSAVTCIHFSPNGEYVAVAKERGIRIWKAPPLLRTFAPLRLIREFNDHSGYITSLTWCAQSTYVLSASEDLTCRLFHCTDSSITAKVFSGFSSPVIGCFLQSLSRLVLVSQGGGVMSYAKVEMGAGEEKVGLVDEFNYPRMVGIEAEGIWKKEFREEGPFFFTMKNEEKQKGAEVVSCDFDEASALLLVGFDNGVFGIYSVPDCRCIHTLSVTHSEVDAVSLQEGGEWVAIGCKDRGQLLVWDWKAENYILKQQGQQENMSCAAYHPQGAIVATGSEDGRVKLWKIQSGFSYVTFHEHQGSVTQLVFSPQGKSVFSASLDGTVRAYDLVRYRNFRTFRTPDPMQFNSIALDPSGEIVIAGTLEPYAIAAWSVQTGDLLEVYYGHEGPVSGLSFHPSKPVFASSSWDRSARVWELYTRKLAVEVLEHDSEVLSVAWHPNGEILATTTLKGELLQWGVEDSVLISAIDGNKDIRGPTRAIEGHNRPLSKIGGHFKSVSYSANGETLIVGGLSTYVCVYHARERVLLKKVSVSKNRSLEGTFHTYKNSWDSEGGLPEALLLEQVEREHDILPGAQTGVLSGKKRMEMKVHMVIVSKTGRSWAAVTTEGLMVYTMDNTTLFDPFDIDEEITPDSVLSALQDKMWMKALLMGLRLNQVAIVDRVYHAIPVEMIPGIVNQIPGVVVYRLLSYVAEVIPRSPHIAFHLLWLNGILKYHSLMLLEQKVNFLTLFRDLYAKVEGEYKAIDKVCDETTLLVGYTLC